MQVANYTGTFYDTDLFKEQGPRAVLGRGPHFAVWSDLTLLLVTYAHTLQLRQQQLPAIKGLPSSS